MVKGHARASRSADPAGDEPNHRQRANLTRRNTRLYYYANPRQRSACSHSRQHGDGLQGNRVKESCGDKACEEFVVPGGDLAAETKGVLSRSPPDQVVGHVFECREISRGVFGSNPAFVVAEDHVHDPVETIFNGPVAPDDWADKHGQKC